MNLCTCTRRRRSGHGLGGHSPAGHRGDSGVLSGQSCVGFMVDRVARDRFFSGHFSYLLSVYLHQCFTRTSVFCCQHVSTNSRLQALQFSAVRVSPQALEFYALNMSPPLLHTHFFLCCQYVSSARLETLKFSAVTMSPHAFSFLLSQCLHTHLVFCCQNVSTRTSVFCCQYVSTIAPHPLCFCCQYVSTSSPHALKFSAVSTSPPVPKGSIS